MGRFDEMAGLSDGAIELTRRPLSTLGEQGPEKSTSATETNYGSAPKETKADPNSAYRPMPKAEIGTDKRAKPTAAALRTSTPAQHNTD